MPALGLGLGIPFTRGQKVTRGPELAPATNSGTWSISLNSGGAGTVTQDASGLHFAGAQNVAAIFKTSVATEDNTVYEVTFTIANYVGGGAKVIVYGATTLHSGGTTNHSAAGTFTEQVTTSSTGSLATQIRIQAIGANGTNTFDVTAISVKKVLP